MIKALSLVAAVVLVAGATKADAASFNCRTAELPAEIAVCKNDGLSEKDDRMAVLYRYAREGVGAAERRRVRNVQRRWLRERNDCGYDFGCLHAVYDSRLAELQGH